MSNDTARQIEEMAQDVDPFGWSNDCPESLREHYQNNAKVIAEHLHAAGYTKPAHAARPSAEEIAGKLTLQEAVDMAEISLIRWIDSAWNGQIAGDARDYCRAAWGVFKWLREDLGLTPCPDDKGDVPIAEAIKIAPQSYEELAAALRAEQATLKMERDEAVKAERERCISVAKSEAADFLALLSEHHAAKEKPEHLAVLSEFVTDLVDLLVTALEPG